MYICVYVYMCICVYVYMCICVYVYMCIYIYIYQLIFENRVPLSKRVEVFLVLFVVQKLYYVYNIKTLPASLSFLSLSLPFSFLSF